MRYNKVTINPEGKNRGITVSNIKVIATTKGSYSMSEHNLKKI